MSTDTVPQLLDRAYAILLRELGPVDFARVMQHLSGGHGDYTQDRREWLDKISLAEANALIRAQQKPSP